MSVGTGDSLGGDASRPVTELSPVHQAVVPKLLVVGLFVALFVGGFFGAFAAMALSSMEMGDLIVPSVVGLSLVALLGTVVSGLLNAWTTTYRIYDDRIEKETGVLSTNLKTVDVTDIVDVKYSQGAFESLFDVGTVGLNTAGDSADEIRLEHVRDAREIYEKFNGIT